MLGLDDAGKTSILYKLKGLDHAGVDQVTPTIGFNVETIHYNQEILNIWDVCGGKPKTRALWQHYNKNTEIIIFVLDSSADWWRLLRASEELKWLWWHKDLKRAVFLIYANKQDLPSAQCSYALVQALNLSDLQPYHPWVIQECSAKTGEGLWNGIHSVLQLYHLERSKRRCWKLLC